MGINPKRQRILSLLFGIAILLGVFTLLGIDVYLSGWLNSYSAYKGDKIIGELVIYLKTKVNDVPHITAEYVPRKDNVSAYWNFLKFRFKNQQEPVKADLIGDKVYLHVDFIKWSGTFNMNSDEAYKVSEMSTGFFNAGDLNKYGSDVVPIILEDDGITKAFQDDPKMYSFFIKDAYKYSVSAEATNRDIIYSVVLRKGAVELVAKN